MKLTLKSDINFIKSNIDIDMCCFGVDKENKLSDDRYFIFYNQLNSPEKSIKKVQDKNIFEIDEPEVNEVTTIKQDGNFVKNNYLEKKDRVQKLVLQKAPHLIDLTKKVAITLKKKSMQKIIARVVVVLDKSGSMNHQYVNGDVQKAMDKLLPIALMFDDDSESDAWAFAEKSKHLSPISLDNIKDYLVKEAGGWKKWNISGINNEPCIIQEIINMYNGSDLPTYIIFISDGGIYKQGSIKKLMIESSKYQIFWKFVGIGGNNYGVLEKLDNLSGRVVDNANFFSIDNINSLSDEALYEKLLNEFPMWLKEASSKGIIKKL